MSEQLWQTVGFIVGQSDALRRKYVPEIPARLDFACVFCQSDEEYDEFSHDVSSKGKVVQNTPSGFTYLLNESFKTPVGPLRLLKIRKPDSNRPECGDADFDTGVQYVELKNTVVNNSHFELVERPDLEMLRLSDAQFNVMACFSKEPLSKKLKIT